MPSILLLVVGLVLMLAAMVLGAIVTLRVVRHTQDASSSIQQYSKDVMSLAIETLASQEREITRDRSLNDMARTMEALNLSVGNLVLMTRSLGMDGSIRTVHSRPMQVGETPTGAPTRAVPAQKPLPPEGLADEERPKGSSPAAETTRKLAFAEPT